MNRKKGTRAYDQKVVNIVILVIILALFLYLAVQLSSGFHSSVSTQRTQTVTEKEYISLEGFVFKDEQLIYSNGQGIVDYKAYDGEKLGVGTEYALFYPTPELSGDELITTQRELTSLSRQLSVISSSGGRVTDLESINSEISRAYLAYMDAVSRGDFLTAQTEGSRLISRMSDRNVITAGNSSVQGAEKTVEEAKKQLILSLGTSAVSMKADQSCYFYSKTDGFEAEFSTEGIEGLTYSALLEKHDASALSYGSEVIGKIIKDPKWYIALPADTETSLRFTEGEIYKVSFSSGDGKSSSMLLERIYSGEDGSYLLLSSYDLSLANRLLRRQSINIEMGSTTGYSIPKSALTTLNGEDGVYILIGTVVEFRRVTVIGEGSGYILAETYEEDAAKVYSGDTPYLYENDLIITSGNSLYHGKLLD